MRSFSPDGRVRHYEEDDLVRLAAEGDSAAFVTLSESYRSVIAKAAGVGITGAEPEDVLQEGYLALLSAVRTYSPGEGAAFRTYATVCINNRLASVARNSGTKKNRVFRDYSALADNDMAADSNYEPEFAVFARDRIDTIKEFISVLLSETENRVLMLYLSGLSYAETAKKLDMTEKSVDNALARARRKLRKALDEQQ